MTCFNAIWKTLNCEGLALRQHAFLTMAPQMDVGAQVVGVAQMGEETRPVHSPSRPIGRLGPRSLLDQRTPNLRRFRRSRARRDRAALARAAIRNVATIVGAAKEYREHLLDRAEHRLRMAFEFFGRRFDRCVGRLMTCRLGNAVGRPGNAWAMAGSGPLQLSISDCDRFDLRIMLNLASARRFVGRIGKSCFLHHATNHGDTSNRKMQTNARANHLSVSREAEQASARRKSSCGNPIGHGEADTNPTDHS